VVVLYLEGVIVQLLLVVAKAQSSGRGSHVIFLQLALDEELIPGPRDVALCGVRSGLKDRREKPEREPTPNDTRVARNLYIEG
jgi:hypothetical protein